MKKIFIKPEAKKVAMQSENMILAGSQLMQGTGNAPTTAESKRATTFQWN